MELIDKAALVAEIEKRIAEVEKAAKELPSPAIMGLIQAYKNTLSFLDTLEVKEVEDIYECPTIRPNEDVSVTSRMKYIDDELIPVANFVLEYADWNLHKEEWNHPVLEVPVFRVLDALRQKGKPYRQG